MPPLIQSLGLDHLSRDERTQLAEELWESVTASQPKFVLTDAQKQELDRRIDALQKDPSRALDWDEVQTRLGTRGA